MNNTDNFSILQKRLISKMIEASNLITNNALKGDNFIYINDNIIKEISTKHNISYEEACNFISNYLDFNY